jgi:predicted Zn-dependent peptidase
MSKSGFGTHGNYSWRHFMKARVTAFGTLLVLAAALASTAGAVGFEDLESKVKEFTLPNGLTFVVLERHDAPVFSFRTYVDAGGVDEVPGITGIAHMFEHMAFKGTPTVGTKDFPAEQEAMAAEDAAAAALEAELNNGMDADSTRLGELEAAFKEAQTKAKDYVESNEFSKVLDANGVVGMNASTFTDWTQYYYSLPSNRLQLWARMEGDRLSNPVLREFYSERDVVYEERRFSESSPTGRLFLDWMNAAYQAHPYGIGGVIGHSSDVKRLTRDDARRFFDKYYVGSNLTVAVVGDVKFEDVKKFAEEYFLGVKAGENPPPLRTVEPRHDYEVRIIREEDAQPFVLVGYHIPAGNSPDYMAADLLGEIIGSGRSSRIYKRLVKKDKIAAQAGAGAGVLGTKYPTLLIVQALVAKDATVDQVESAIYEELDRLAEDGPTPEELDKVKTRAKASYIRGLRSNNGLAGNLAQYEELWGDWRKMFTYLDELNAVTVEDVQRVAKEALRPGNRVVGIMKRPAEKEKENAAS